MTRRTATSARVPTAASRSAPLPKRLRATRNGPRISSSAVMATVVNPASVASSAAARRSRVLPMPRLTLERDRRQVAPGLPDGLFDGRQLHRPPDDRARRAAELDIQRALRLDERVEGLALEEPHRAAGPVSVTIAAGLCAPIAFDPARLPAGPGHEKAAGLGARRPFGCGSVEPSWIRPGRYPFGFDRGARSSRPPRSRRRSRRR